MISPENSEPEIHGRGGWCWYLPRIWSRSKKLVAVLWMRMVYWSGVGIGSGRSVTLRSRGPWCRCQESILMGLSNAGLERLTETYSFTWMPRIVAACQLDVGRNTIHGSIRKRMWCIRW